MYVELVQQHCLVGDVDKESMIPALPETEEAPKPLLVMFTHHSGHSSEREGERQSEGEAEREKYQRQLEIGCVKSSLVKKNSGDFSIDVMAASNPFAKCFNFDTVKVTAILMYGQQYCYWLIAGLCGGRLS